MNINYRLGELFSGPDGLALAAQAARVDTGEEFIRFLTLGRQIMTKTPAKLIEQISVLKAKIQSFTKTFANSTSKLSKRFLKLTRWLSVFRAMIFQSSVNRKVLTAFSVRFINTALMF